MYDKKQLIKLEKEYLDQCEDIDLQFKDWLIANEIHELTRAITSLKGI